MNREVTFYDWFAGCGGASQGLKQNLKPLLAIEFWREAWETYRANHGSHNLLVDIRLMDFQYMLEVHGYADHIHFSPPCQEFSPLNFAGGKGFVSERGGLMWEPYRLLMKAKTLDALPYSWSLENVKGLVNRKNLPTFLKWIEAMESIGYVVRWRVVNMADYGVPQTRERVIAWASLDGALQLPEPTHSDAWITGAEALGVPGETVYWDDDVYNKASMDGQTRRYDLKDRPAPTVDARTGGRPWLFVNGKWRRWTVEDGLLFQSFPKGYQMSGKTSDQNKQIGNACPPKFFELFGAAIRDAVLRRG